MAKKNGRPSKYTRALAAKICQRIAEGVPLTKICMSSAMPAYRTVLDWRVNNTEFSRNHVRPHSAHGGRTPAEIAAKSDKGLIPYLIAPTAQNGHQMQQGLYL